VGLRIYHKTYVGDSSAFEGKAGAWLIEFIQKLKERNLGLAMVIEVGGVVGGRCVGLQNVGVDAA